MSETALIADQLRRAFYGEAWHGDSLFEILKGVGAERAAERPVDVYKRQSMLMMRAAPRVAFCRTMFAGIPAPTSSSNS